MKNIFKKAGAIITAAVLGTSVYHVIAVSASAEGSLFESECEALTLADGAEGVCRQKVGH